MVDTALMTPEEVAWLDTYHQQVRAGVRRPPPAHSPSLPLIHGGLLAGVGGGVSPRMTGSDPPPPLPFSPRCCCCCCWQVWAAVSPRA